MKSPVFSYVNASFEGLQTIRAFQAEKIVQNQFNAHQVIFLEIFLLLNIQIFTQDVHTSAWFLCISYPVAYGLWIDIICVLFLSFIIMKICVLGII